MSILRMTPERNSSLTEYHHGRNYSSFEANSGQVLYFHRTIKCAIRLSRYLLEFSGQWRNRCCQCGCQAKEVWFEDCEFGTRGCNRASMSIKAVATCSRGACSSSSLRRTRGSAATHQWPPLSGSCRATRASCIAEWVVAADANVCLIRCQPDQMIR